MKKIIYTSLCLVAGTCFAYAGNGKSPIKKVEKAKEEAPTCSVSCSTKVTNSSGLTVTYTTSAGNFLTSCSSAITKCENKLKQSLGVEATSITVN